MADAPAAGAKSPLSTTDGLLSVPDSPPADPRIARAAVTDSPAAPRPLAPPSQYGHHRPSLIRHRESPLRRRPAPPGRRLAARWPASVSVARFVAALVLAIIGFGIVLLLQGRNPIDAYVNMFSVTLGTAFGRSEVVVKAIPLMLCALAVALPARVGLVNVGGEGQLYPRRVAGKRRGPDLHRSPIWLMLPLMLVASIVGGALWALLPAILRAKNWLNETISTLLLNYVAVLLVQFFVFGPWKDPKRRQFPPVTGIRRCRQAARIRR